MKNNKDRAIAKANKELLEEVEKIIDENSIGIQARTFAKIKRELKDLISTFSELKTSKNAP